MHPAKYTRKAPACQRERVMQKDTIGIVDTHVYFPYSIANFLINYLGRLIS
jgi:hypothetical protein